MSGQTGTPLPQSFPPQAQGNVPGMSQGPATTNKFAPANMPGMPGIGHPSSATNAPNGFTAAGGADVPVAPMMAQPTNTNGGSFAPNSASTSVYGNAAWGPTASGPQQRGSSPASMYSFGPGTPSSVSAPAAPQKRRSGKAMLGIIILLLALIGGGIGGYIFLFPQEQMPKQAVTTPYPPAKGTATFADAFKDNAQQWGLQNAAGKYSIAIDQGKLVLEDNDNKVLPVFLPNNKPLDNFQIVVDATLTKGDEANGYGIYIRAAVDQNGNVTTCYRFELYGDRSYAIFKVTGNTNGKMQLTPLVDGTLSDAIQPAGKSNHIQIAANGAKLTLAVNGQELKTISDTTYTSGVAALFLSNVQGTRPGAQVQFSNLAVYPN